MRRVVLAIPPLPVGEQFIDNPAFAFLPPLLWAAAAAEQVALQVDNVMASGAPLLRTPGGWLIGGEPAATWNRLANTECDDLVIAWSSYHRRVDPAGLLLPAANHPVFARPERNVHLAEFWHAESRLEPQSSVRSIAPDRPFASRSAEGFDVECRPLLGLPVEAGSAPLRPEWVSAASIRAMALLDPIVRTGAADGATEAYPPGQGPRAEGRFWPLMTSMGCSYRCLFCHKPGRAGTWQPRPIEAIEQELDTLARAGVRLVFMLDPIANYDADHFMAVLGAIDARGLRAVFPNGLAVKHLNESVLERLRTVTSDLIVSLESGSPRSLETLRKPVDLTQAEGVLAMAARLGFNLSAHLMIGVPGESTSEVAKTLGLAKHLHDELGVAPSIQRYVPPGQTDGGAFDSGAGKQAETDATGQAQGPSSASPVSLETAAMWVREYARGTGTPKIIINLSYACNNHCSFCAVADRPRIHGLLDEQLRLLREARAQGVRHVDLDGGEPTLYPALPQVLQLAEDLGYERINLTTNGRRLCYPDFADKLARYRSLELSVSLHGPDATTHETLTRVSGSFHQTLSGLWNASRAGIEVALNITAVATNVDRIFETAQLGARMGAKRVAVQRYTPFGAPTSAHEPALDVLMEQVGRIRRELPTLRMTLVNFCACEVGPHAGLAAGDQAKAVRTMQFVDLREPVLATWLSARRRHVAMCDSCYLLQVCAGKWVHDDASEPETDELIDFTPGLSCKSECRFCAVPPEATGADLPTEAAVNMLERLSPRKAGRLRISGGEPTDREDLLELVRRARELGYRRIGIQTHGMRFADTAYVDELIGAGMSEANISVFGANDTEYEAATGMKGGFSRLLIAVETALDRLGDGVKLDILALRPMLPQLAETVALFARMGVSDVMLWLPAYEGRAASPAGADLVPTLREASAPLQRALDLCSDLPGLRVRSIYAPLCILGRHRDKSFDVRRANVLIVNPSMVLPMSRCAVDIGMFPPRCGPCSLKESCLGLRPSYYARVGDAEVTPVLEDAPIPPDGRA